jgi:hypothetical protein
VKRSWLEGRFEGTDVFEGALEVSGLRIFIPYSYNMQGLIFFHWEDVQPGLLEFRAAGTFLIDGPKASWLVMKEAGLGRAAAREPVELFA